MTLISMVDSAPLTEKAVEFIAWLKSPDGGSCTLIGDMGDGRYCAIKPLLFHWTMIVGEIGDRDGYEENYCYADRTAAGEGLIGWAILEFQGEPDGWHRHPKSGRRRPGGDPAKEHIAR